MIKYLFIFFIYTTIYSCNSSNKSEFTPEVINNLKAGGINANNYKELKIEIEKIGKLSPQQVEALMAVPSNSIRRDLIQTVVTSLPEKVRDEILTGDLNIVNAYLKVKFYLSSTFIREIEIATKDSNYIPKQLFTIINKK